MTPEKSLKFCKKMLAFFAGLCYYTRVRCENSVKKHALMREVAHLEWGNFRGVCPILNRAKNTGAFRDTCDPKRNGRAICCPELTATPASTGFIMYRDEKHGTL